MLLETIKKKGKKPLKKVKKGPINCPNDLLYHSHLLLIPYDIRDAFTNRLLGSCQKRAFGKVQKTKRLSKHICPYISPPPLT